MTIGMRRTMAATALKNHWSLDSEIRYRSHTEDVSYAKEQLIQMADQLNAEIRTLTQRIARLLKQPEDAASADAIGPSALPLSPADIWGTPEEWEQVRSMKSARWGALKKELLRQLAARYDQAALSEVLRFTKAGRQASIELVAEGPTIHGQFSYSYLIRLRDGECLVRTSYEAMLGLGSGVWDGATSVTIEDFCAQFAELDAKMQRILSGITNPG